MPIGAIVFVASLLWVQKAPSCPFYLLTGIYCPGCGAGRCVMALLHLDLYAAFRFNPLMFITLPFVLYYLLKIYLAFVFGRDVLPAPNVRKKAFGIIVLSVVLAYFVLRNIPVYPFTLLSPTAV